jgi:glutamate-ammonia-ligase adenylyltransferase
LILVRADSIAPLAAAHARELARGALARTGLSERTDLIELATLLCVAYPPFSRAIDAHPEDLLAIVGGLHRARDAQTYRRLAKASICDGSNPGRMRSDLRRFVAREKLRVSARELLAHPGHDVDITSRELADLADVCCELSLAEAQSWASARFGEPRTVSGDSCAFVVVGMGKLGGRELNAGSDIDLMLFYETDDGQAGTSSLHEHFTKVAQRFVATLEEPTDDGIVWRVDLRLRPEGTRGALVNALPAAERYYGGVRSIPVSCPSWRLCCRELVQARGRTRGTISRSDRAASAKSNSSSNRSNSFGAGMSRESAPPTRTRPCDGCAHAAS